MPSSARSFPGFEPLQSNYVYCPNQFFDVCLPHASRGVIRLLAYLLRRTLGWLDEDGQPIEQDHSVPYGELIDKAGISRGAIKPAVDAAIKGHFIERLAVGRPDRSGVPAESSLFRLRWDDGSKYAKTPDTFAGFFTGEGNRTPIPNAFFDHVVRSEPLSVVKVVGTVLRHTVGYQNQFGGRRQSAPLSHTFIHQYANLSDGKTLSSALDRAQANGYIERVRDGVFTHDLTRQCAACYAVCWRQPATNRSTGSKIPAGESDQFKNPNRTGSESPTADRFKNPSSTKTVSNDTDKQQPPAAVDSEAVTLLRDAGFDAAIAGELARGRGVGEIRQQIEWLDERNPQRNRLGLLRKAIEENWPSPVGTQVAAMGPQDRSRERQQAADRSQEQEESERRRLDQRQTLLARWQHLDHKEQQRLHQRAIDAAVSTIVRRRLRLHTDLDHPPTETLQLLDRQQPVS